MKKLGRKIIPKFTMVLCIIVTMLFSSSMPIIAWAVEAIQTESQYIKFDLKWSNDSDEISMNDGETTAYFNLQFDTINTFKDFRIEVERAELVNVSFSNNGEYFGNSSSARQTQYLKDIPGGTKIEGNINFTFNKTSDFTDYSRAIIVKLIGTYELDGEEINVEITKNLKANITSTAIVTKHSAGMNYKKYSSNVTTSSNTSELYEVNSIRVMYEVNLNCMNTEHTKLEFSLYRKGTNNNNTYYPTNVSFSNSDFSLSKIENEDGTIIYIAEKGEEHDEYLKSNMYYLDGKYYLTVNYTVENPEEEGSTTIISDVKLTSDGYTNKTDATGTTNTKTKITADDSTQETIIVYRYTPGTASWGNSNIYTSLGSYNYSQESLKEFVESDKMSISFDTRFKYTKGVDYEGSTTVTQNVGSIRYYDTNAHNYSYYTLTEDEMYLKTIEVNSMPSEEDAWIKFYKLGSSEPFFTATYDNLTYTVDENLKIGSYYAKANNINIHEYSGWKTTYEMCASAMKERGLTENQIINIRNIYKTQESSGAMIYTNNRQATYTITGFEKTRISNFGIYDKTTLNSDVSQIGQDIEDSIVLILGEYGLDSTQTGQLEVVNTNPILYVKLPKQFDFDITSISITGNTMKVDSYKIKKVNGSKILQINCSGSNEANIMPQLKINYKRKLKPDVTETSGYLEVYMQTDENEYYTYETDSYDYNENGNILDKLAYAKLWFSITYNSQIQLSNSVYSALGEVKTNEDVILNRGETVKYRVVLDNNYTSIKNVNLVARLPFEGNKSIIGDNLIDLNSTFTITNLKNIKVYIKPKDGKETELQKNRYTIGYSTDELAKFDSEFTNSAEDIQTAKTLQIKLSDEYILSKGYQLIVEYEGEIPEDTEVSKMVIGTSAVSYVDSSSVVQKQEAAGIKVIVGDSAGTIEVIKSFEGTNNTENLEGIRFKITNMDDTSIVYEGITDSNGHVIFNNVPVGDWEIVETTLYDSYISAPRYVKISNGERYTEETGKAIDIINNIKKAKLEIIKKWDDTDSITEQVIFSIEGKTVGGDSYSTTVGTSIVEDEEGNKIQRAMIYVPYGEYTIKETTSLYGWYAEDVKISAKSEVVKAEVLNKIAYGNLQINKTVPQGDNVNGLKFHLYGVGDVGYTNKDGEEVTFNVDETITINENGSGTLNHIPLGTYTLEEIEMPQINTSNGSETRYVPIKKSVRVSQNGITEYVNIQNKWRTGNLDITVTATEGTELNQFRVRVSGTTYYGTNVNQEYDVPSSGKILVRDLPIGTYKVEECNTKEVNGKVLTITPDGYEVTYNPEDVNTNGLKVEYGKTANATIHNEYAGTGIIQIVKSLENGENVGKVAGIQFKIKGKDLVGKDVDETITIGENGRGTSNPIPVGTYLLSEIEETVPEIYQVAEEQEVTITTNNTEESPLVLEIENKLAIGNIIMETELATGGYPSTPVIYSVTKVNDKLNQIEEPIEVTGDEKSYAKLTNLKAGKYLVEQKVIPDGYVKDTRQIVNITRKESGYALFIIDKERIEEFENTKVTINKEIVNEEGNIATEEDFENAKINKEDKYSFEVKIQNIDTKETYYSFIDEKNTDTIVGLPYGTYEVEEVYKPKFKMLEMTGERLNNDEETGKITFTLSADNEEIENRIVINIKNVIDTGFGFGGQDSRDNLSKVLQEEVEKTFVTKAKVYVRDDENNKISDATFKLYDSKGNIVKLAGSEGTYIPSNEGNEVIYPVNGSIVLKALPVGEYKLINEVVSDSFLKSDDRIISIYESAVEVTRIELLRNISRGSIRLSTVYIDDLGEEHYAPSSKYKILDTANDKVLTFIRKADGTYERSNLPNATEKISLKSGYVDVNGIEAGIEYQVGLVDVTDIYGIIKETPEKVSVEEGSSQEVKVSVKNRTGIFTKVITPGSGRLTVALDKEGKIWLCDIDNSNRLGIDANFQLQCIQDYALYSNIKDVRFKDISASSHDSFVAVDKEGKVWTWGSKSLLGDGAMSDRYSPECISNIEGNALNDNNVKIKKVIFESYSGDSVFALDEQGKIWFWGNFGYQEYNNKWLPSSNTPICMSDLCDLKDVAITDIFGGGQNTMIAIDNEGKVWTWGNNYKSAAGLQDSSNAKPTCISNLEGSNIKNIRMKRAAVGYAISLLIDTENHIWAFGSSDYGKIGNGIEDNNLYYWNPICLNSNNPSNPLNGIGIVDVACQYETIAAIDENGKLWTWGKEEDNGQLGTGEKYNNGGSGYNTNYAISPICITNLENNELDTVKLVSTSAPYYNNAAAIDSDGNIWVWGDEGLPIGERNVGTIKAPTKLTMATNAYLDIPNFVKISAGYEHSVGLDEEGKVWSWGNNDRLQLGIGYENYSKTTTNTPVCVGGYNNNISKANIIDISAGYRHTLALDSDGKLWTWGYNGEGQIGLTNEQLGIDGYQADPICISTLDIQGNILYGKKIQKIATNNQHSAVIDSEGKLYTFGYNDYGQLGNGFDTYNSRNSEYNKSKCLNDINTNLSNVKFAEVATGYSHTIALDSEGRVWTWGQNSNGQLGFDYDIGNSSSRVNTPTCISENTSSSLYGIKIKQISAGLYHSMAIDEEGKVWTWGNNNSKQLGDGTTTSTYDPICLSNIMGNKLYGKKITKVLAGHYMSMIIDEEGKIWTCGSSSNGQLGQVEISVGGPADIQCINNDIRLIAKDISLGQNFCLALDSNNDIWSWGSSQNGASGFSSGYMIPPVKLYGKTEKLNPLYNQALNSISDLAGENVTGNLINDETSNIISNVKTKKTASAITMILDEEGKIYTYGKNNSYGILGDGTTEERAEAICINDKFNDELIEEIIYLSNDLAVVKDKKGYIWLWGSNQYGKLGIGTTNITSSSYPVKQEYKVKSANVYGNTVLIVNENDELYMWGQNNYGQCGTNESNVVSPTHVDGLYVKQILSYANTIIVLDNENRLWTWGQNSYGQCGTGGTANKITPGKVSDSEGNIITVDKVISKGTTNIVQDTEGRIWAWGQNSYGQCGTGNKVSVLTPTQINESNGLIVKEVMTAVTSTSMHIVKDTENKIWTWGYNGSGLCGTGDNVNVLQPTCISTETDFQGVNIIEITNNAYIITAKDEEGKIWTWGKNDYGQCGTGAEETYCKPKCLNSVSGIEDVRFDKISQSSSRITAVDTEGKTWVWGNNTKYGILGIGTDEPVVKTPICRDDYFKQIGLELGSSGITKNPRSNTCYAIDINNDIWTWGENTYGQCGTGTTDTVLIPTCITKEKNIKFDSFISVGVYVVIRDENGKVWTWGSNNFNKCGTGTTEDVLEPTCINNDNTFVYEKGDKYFSYNSVAPASNVAPIYKYAYILKQNGDVWLWGNGILTPTKLNNLEEINNTKIKEIAVNTANEKIDILTEDGIIYRVSNTFEVEDVSKAEVIGYYLENGPWKNEFKIVKNAKYTR